MEESARSAVAHTICWKKAELKLGYCPKQDEGIVDVTKDRVVAVLAWAWVFAVLGLYSAQFKDLGRAIWALGRGV